MAAHGRFRRWRDAISGALWIVHLFVLYGVIYGAPDIMQIRGDVQSKMLSAAVFGTGVGVAWAGYLVSFRDTRVYALVMTAYCGLLALNGLILLGNGHMLIGLALLVKAAYDAIWYKRMTVGPGSEGGSIAFVSEEIRLVLEILKSPYPSLPLSSGVVVAEDGRNSDVPLTAGILTRNGIVGVVAGMCLLQGLFLLFWASAFLAALGSYKFGGPLEFATICLVISLRWSCGVFKYVITYIVTYVSTAYLQALVDTDVPPPEAESGIFGTSSTAAAAAAAPAAPGVGRGRESFRERAHSLTLLGPEDEGDAESAIASSIDDFDDFVRRIEEETNRGEEERKTDVPVPAPASAPASVARMDLNAALDAVEAGVNDRSMDATAVSLGERHIAQFPPVSALLKAAFTTSIGSVCLASLLGIGSPSLWAARRHGKSISKYFAGLALVLSDTSVSAADRSREGLFGPIFSLSPGAFSYLFYKLSTAFACISNLASKWLQVSHKYALVLVSTQGRSLLPSARQVWKHFERSGTEAVIEEDATDKLLLISCSACGMLVSLLLGTAFVSCPEGTEVGECSGIWILTFLLVFYIGFLSSWLPMTVLEASISALFVAFSRVPECLSGRTLIYHRFQRLAELARLEAHAHRQRTSR